MSPRAFLSRRTLVRVAAAITMTSVVLTPPWAAATPTNASTSTAPITSRLAGVDRVETAVRISQHAFPNPFTTGGSVYLARKDVFADAMAAGTLIDGPVLLVPTCGLVPQIVTAEIVRLAPARVVALGDEGAVCNQVLYDAAGGRAVTRLGGVDRYATALAIAWERARQGPVTEVYLANALDRPDAVVGGQLGQGPILLSAPNRPVTDDERNFVNLKRPRRVVALGGEDVVPQTLLDSITSGFDPSATSTMGRLAGPSRYETAAAIAYRQFPADAGTVYLARGDVYADAVAGGVLRDGPVLLVGQCSLPLAARERIAAARPRQIIALGSTGAVCDGVLAEAVSARTVSGGRTALLHSDGTDWAVPELPTSAAFSDNGQLAWSGGVAAANGQPKMDGVYKRLLAQGADSALLSLSPSGTSLASTGTDVSIDAVGRMVVFMAAEVDGNGVRRNHVWVRDTSLGETRLVSRRPDGGLPNGNSFHAQVSADGSTVVFASVATDLVDGDTNAAPDIFSADLATGTVTLVSRGRDGGPADGTSSYAQVSSDGRFVAYRTAATNVVSGDSNGVADIVVTDRSTMSTQLVSHRLDGTALTVGAAAPSLSADGRLVGYTTGAADGLYVYDTVDGTTVLASRDAQNQPLPASAGRISADGRHIVFAQGTVGPLGEAAEWYRRDLGTGELQWLTAGFAGQSTGKMSRLFAVNRDATQVAFGMSYGGGFVLDAGGYGDYQQQVWSQFPTS